MGYMEKMRGESADRYRYKSLEMIGRISKWIPGSAIERERVDKYRELNGKLGELVEMNYEYSRMNMEAQSI